MNIIRHECESSGELLLAGKHRIDFDYAHDVVMDVWHRLAAHPNGMRFQAFDQQNNLVDEQVWYSIGGGFVRQGNAEDLMIGIHERPPIGTSFADQQSDSSLDDGSDVPYPFTSCRRTHCIMREVPYEHCRHCVGQRNGHAIGGAGSQRTG